MRRREAKRWTCSKTREASNRADRQSKKERISRFFFFLARQIERDSVFSVLSRLVQINRMKAKSTKQKINGKNVWNFRWTRNKIRSSRFNNFRPETSEWSPSSTAERQRRASFFELARLSTLDGRGELRSVRKPFQLFFFDDRNSRNEFQRKLNELFFFDRRSKRNNGNEIRRKFSFDFDQIGRLRFHSSRHELDGFRDSTKTFFTEIIRALIKRQRSIRVGRKYWNIAALRWNSLEIWPRIVSLDKYSSWGTVAFFLAL